MDGLDGRTGLVGGRLRRGDSWIEEYVAELVGWLGGVLWKEGWMDGLGFGGVFAADCFLVFCVIVCVRERERERERRERGRSF